MAARIKEDRKGEIRSSYRFTIEPGCSRAPENRSADARALLAGLFADPGIFRNRGSANASQRADVMSQSKELATSAFWHIPDSSRNSAFACGVRAATANSAQRSVAPRHSFGIVLPLASSREMCCCQ
jgi:hypothetical protein